MRTLLLNISGEPLKLMSWSNAIRLVFADKATVLEEYDSPLRSCYLNMNKPAVIRLNTYHKTKYGVRLSRENIYARDGYRCQYCGERYGAEYLTLDHIIPKSRSGKDSWKNLVTCCTWCNNKKDNKTPSEAEMPLLRIPEQPGWMPSLLVKAIKYKNIPEQWNGWIKWMDESLAQS
jgi:5-methylcytosine-specific restriction endonuclease McrA